MSEVHRLDSICEIIMGQAPDGSAYNDDGYGWPLIAGPGDFGEHHPLPKKFTTEASKLSKPGDIVLSIRATIGEKVISDGEYCLGRGVAGIRSKPQLDTRFLWHWLSHIKPKLAEKGKGATFKQVNKQDIDELEITLPPIPEQRRIAAILDKADALRDKRREALAQLDELTQSIFIEMFGDPVANPMGWPLSKLGDVGALDRGVSKHRPRNDPKLLGGKYPLIQTGDVANCDGYIHTHSNTYSESGLKQSKLWPVGTLCITIAANIAKTGILKIDACFPDSVVGFRTDSEATVEYVRVWLSFLQKKLEESAPESAQKNINLAILRDLEVPLPPIVKQHSFHEALRKRNTLRARLVANQYYLNSLFASLQHRAFRGEL
ncbi:MAG: hypothetical protein RLZZ09_1754 [Pseudomonadota bacterium]